MERWADWPAEDKVNDWIFSGEPLFCERWSARPENCLPKRWPRKSALLAHILAESGINPIIRPSVTPKSIIAWKDKKFTPLEEKYVGSGPLQGARPAFVEILQGGFQFELRERAWLLEDEGRAQWANTRMRDNISKWNIHTQTMSESKTWAES